jgi:hypothetical protein
MNAQAEDKGTVIDYDSPEVIEYLNGIIKEIEGSFDEGKPNPLSRVPMALTRVAGPENGSQLADRYVMGLANYTVEISIADGARGMVTFDGVN